MAKANKILKSYDYAEALQALVVKHPPCQLVTSSDDEGNEFNPVVFRPVMGYYDKAARSFIPDDDTEEFKKKINAVCLN